MNLNPVNIIKNIFPQHSQKPYSLYKFSSKRVSGWCLKKHLHCTISRRLRTSFSKHLESKCLYIPVYLRKKIYENLFRLIFETLIHIQIHIRYFNSLPTATYC